MQKSEISTFYRTNCLLCLLIIIKKILSSALMEIKRWYFHRFAEPDSLVWLQNHSQQDPVSFIGLYSSNYSNCLSDEYIVLHMHRLPNAGSQLHHYRPIVFLVTSPIREKILRFPGDFWICAVRRCPLDENRRKFNAKRIHKIGNSHRLSNCTVLCNFIQSEGTYLCYNYFVNIG